MFKSSRIWLAALALAIPSTTQAHARLQCVPFARSLSGIAIHGNANTWWDQAAGRYQRGDEPQIGAVLSFAAARAMPLGHVAVVSKIIDDRQILLDHANWSRPGLVERQALAVDVSPQGDWSAVRVWYSPNRSLGSRINPTFGFIYGSPVEQPQAFHLASVEELKGPSLLRSAR
jgi:hypothetical protein